MRVCWRDAVQEEKHKEGPQVALSVLVVFGNSASEVLFCWVQVFVALAGHLVDFGILICFLSLAVQALKLGKLGFIIIVDVGSGGRVAAGKAGKADAAAALLNGDVVSALSR